jgi:translin
MDDLNSIAEWLRTALTEKNTARDAAIARSRELIRHCSECIRAIHRREWSQAESKFETIQTVAAGIRTDVAGHLDLYYSGYTQDALKEVAEAYITYAIIRGQPLPTPQSLNIEASTYLLGMAEAATELRRFILDIMRQKDGHSEEAEHLLEWMDSIYDQLVTFDFPDAITGGLRRQTDVVRGVLERTRGDLTQSLRQQQLQDALQQFEERLKGKN